MQVSVIATNVNSWNHDNDNDNDCMYQYIILCPYTIHSDLHDNRTWSWKPFLHSNSMECYKELWALLKQFLLDSNYQLFIRPIHKVK